MKGAPSGLRLREASAKQGGVMLAILTNFEQNYNSVFYGNMETVGGIFLYQKARSEGAEFNLDALHAWHQQDQPVYVPGGPDHHFY
jgi:hypothetical protein